MDPLTQGLLGAAAAQLGFRQKLGAAATWIAAITAMLADLDILARPILKFTGAEIDGFTMMRTHRALSHSLLAVPVIALLTALPWWWRRRRRAAQKARTQLPRPVVDRTTHPEVAADLVEELALAPRVKPPSFWPLYACTFVAALTHPLLDYCTSYGTQLLAPFSNARLALDAVPIIDIIYTPMLIITLVACLLVRKLKSRRAGRATLIIGWLGIILSTGYIAAGYALGRLAQQRAVELAVEDGTQRKDIRQTMAYPHMGTIFLWRTTVRTDEQWFVSRIRPLDGSPVKPADRQRAPVATHLLISKARELPQVKTYDWFARGQIRAEYARDGSDRVVTFHDMRYGRTISDPDSMWPAEVRFDWQGNIIGARRVRHIRDKLTGGLIRNIWNEIWR